MNDITNDLDLYEKSLLAQQQLNQSLGYTLGGAEYDNAGMTEYEHDLKYMPAGDFAAKYGDEALFRDKYPVDQGISEYLADENANRSWGEALQDSAVGVAKGTVGSVGGAIAGLAGAFNDKLGIAGSKLVSNISNDLDSFSSDALQKRRRAMLARDTMGDRDINARYAQEIAKGDSPLLADLRKAGRQAINTVTNYGTDAVLASDLAAQGAGSLLPGSLVAKGVRSLAGAVGIGEKATSKAAWPTSIGMLEGGGGYTQGIEDVMSMSYEDLAKNSPEFISLVQGYLEQGKTMPDALQQAKEDIASAVGTRTGIASALSAMALSKFSKWAERPFSNTPSLVKGAQNTLGEAVEEGGTAIGGTLAQNMAVQALADANRSTTHDLGRQVAENALGGALSAGPMQIPALVHGAVSSISSSDLKAEPTVSEDIVDTSSLETFKASSEDDKTKQALDTLSAPKIPEVSEEDKAKLKESAEIGQEFLKNFNPDQDPKQLKDPDIIEHINNVLNGLEQTDMEQSDETDKLLTKVANLKNNKDEQLASLGSRAEEILTNSSEINSIDDSDKSINYPEELKYSSKEQEQIDFDKNIKNQQTTINTTAQNFYDEYNNLGEKVATSSSKQEENLAETNLKSFDSKIESLASSNNDLDKQIVLKYYDLLAKDQNTTVKELAQKMNDGVVKQLLLDPIKSRSEALIQRHKNTLIQDGTEKSDEEIDALLEEVFAIAEQAEYLAKTSNPDDKKVLTNFYQYIASSRKIPFDEFIKTMHESVIKQALNDSNFKYEGSKEIYLEKQTKRRQYRELLNNQRSTRRLEYFKNKKLKEAQQAIQKSHSPATEAMMQSVLLHPYHRESLSEVGKKTIESSTNKINALSALATAYEKSTDENEKEQLALDIAKLNYSFESLLDKFTDSKEFEELDENSPMGQSLGYLFSYSNSFKNNAEYQKILKKAIQKVQATQKKPLNAKNMDTDEGGQIANAILYQMSADPLQVSEENLDTLVNNYYEAGSTSAEPKLKKNPKPIKGLTLTDEQKEALLVSRNIIKMHRATLEKVKQLSKIQQVGSEIISSLTPNSKTPDRLSMAVHLQNIIRALNSEGRAGLADALTSYNNFVKHQNNKFNALKQAIDTGAISQKYVGYATNGTPLEKDIKIGNLDFVRAVNAEHVMIQAINQDLAGLLGEEQVYPTDSLQITENDIEKWKAKREQIITNKINKKNGKENSKKNTSRLVDVNGNPISSKPNPALVEPTMKIEGEVTPIPSVKANFNKLLHISSTLFTDVLKNSKSPIKDLFDIISNNEKLKEILGEDAPQFTEEDLKEWKKILGSQPGSLAHLIKKQLELTLFGVKGITGYLAKEITDKNTGKLKSIKKFLDEGMSEYLLNATENGILNLLVKDSQGNYVLDPVLIDKAILATINQLLLTKTNPYKSYEDVAESLNIPLYALTPEIANTYYQSTYAPSFYEDIFKAIMRSWGAKIDQDQFRGVSENIARSVGVNIIQSIMKVKPKLLHKVTVDAKFDQVTEIQEGKNKGKEIETEITKTLSFLQINLEAFAPLVSDSVKSNRALIENLMYKEKNKDAATYYGDHIPSVSKKVRNTDTPLSDKEIETQKRANGMKYYLNPIMVKFMKAVGANINFALGLDSSDEFKNINLRAIDVSKEDINKRALDLLDISLKEMQEIAEIANIPLEEVEKHFAYDLTIMGRLQERSPDGPTSNKLTRVVTRATKSVIDLSSEDSIDFQIYASAIDQALGEKIGHNDLSKNVETLHKIEQDLEPTLNIFRNWLKANNTKDISDDLSTLSIEDLTKIYKNISESGYDVSHEGFHVLMDYANFLNMKESNSEGLKKYTSYLSVEADGIAHGLITTIKLFRTDPDSEWIKSLKRGGVSVGQTKTEKEAYEEVDEKDIYEVMGDELASRLYDHIDTYIPDNPEESSILKGLAVNAIESLNALVINNPKKEIDADYFVYGVEKDDQANKSVSIPRVIMKKVGQTRNYTAGADVIASHLVHPMFLGFYSKISDAAKFMHEHPNATFWEAMFPELPSDSAKEACTNLIANIQGLCVGDIRKTKIGKFVYDRAIKFNSDESAPAEKVQSAFDIFFKNPEASKEKLELVDTISVEDLLNFTVNSGDFKRAQRIVSAIFGEPAKDAVDKVLGKSTTEARDTIVGGIDLATSTYAAVYEQAVLDKIHEYENDKSIKYHARYGIKPSDEKAIEESLQDWKPVFDLKDEDGNLVHHMDATNTSENIVSNKVVTTSSINLDESTPISSSPQMKNTSSSGGSVFPKLIMALGDGSMIMNFAIGTAFNVNLVFDGIEASLADALKVMFSANEAEAKTFRYNPMKPIAAKLALMAQNAENHRDVLLRAISNPEIRTKFISNALYKNSAKDVKDFSNEDLVDNIIGVLQQNARQALAIEVKIDTMLELMKNTKWSCANMGGLNQPWSNPNAKEPDPNTYDELEFITNFRAEYDEALLKNFEKAGLIIEDGDEVTLSYPITRKREMVKKDQLKSSQANKFVGWGVPGSSTERYRLDWRNRANMGVYTNEDRVFVSVNGARANAVPFEDIAPEVQLAIDAGATIIADTAKWRFHKKPDGKFYNTGEIALMKYLQSHDYIEAPANSGHWFPKGTRRAIENNKNGSNENLIIPDKTPIEVKQEQKVEQVKQDFVEQVNETLPFVEEVSEPIETTEETEVEQTKVEEPKTPQSTMTISSIISKYLSFLGNTKKVLMDPKAVVEKIKEHGLHYKIISSKDIPSNIPKNVNAWYDEVNNAIIVVDPRQLSKEEFEKKFKGITPEEALGELLLHESIHAVFKKSLNLFVNTKTRSKLDIKFRKAGLNIENALDTLIFDNLTKIPLAHDPELFGLAEQLGLKYDEEEKVFKAPYTKSQLHKNPELLYKAMQELIAYSLSSTSVNSYLSRITTPTSMMGRLKSLAKTVLKNIYSAFGVDFEATYVSKLNYSVELSAIALLYTPAINTSVVEEQTPLQGSLFHISAIEPTDRHLSEVSGKYLESLKTTLNIIHSNDSMDTPEKRAKELTKISKIISDNPLKELDEIYKAGIVLTPEEEKAFTIISNSLNVSTVVNSNALQDIQTIYEECINQLANSNKIDIKLFNYLAGAHRPRDKRYLNIPVFIALATVSPKVRELLNGLKLTKIKPTKQGTIASVVTNLGNAMTDALNSALGSASFRDGESLKSAVDKAIRNITEVSPKFSLRNRERNYLDKVNDYFAKTFKPSTTYTPREKAIIAKATAISNSLGKLVEIAIAVVTSPDIVKREITSALNLNEYLHNFGILFRSIFGSDKFGQVVEALVKKAKAQIQQTRQRWREAVPVVIKQKFKGTASKEDFELMTKVLVQTDIASLGGDSFYDTKSIRQILSDNRIVENKIRGIETQLRNQYSKDGDADFMIHKAHQLAEYMINGTVSPHLLRNAYAIAGRFGYHKPKKVDAGLTRDISTLVTLYSLTLIEKKDKQRIIELIDKAPEAMEIVVGNVFQTRKLQYIYGESSLTKINGQKGYVPRILDKNQTYRVVAHGSEESKNLKELGYQLIDTNEAFDYYYIPYSLTPGFNQGGFQNITRASFGANTNTGFSLDGSTLVLPKNIMQKLVSQGKAIPVYNEKRQLIAVEAPQPKNSPVRYVRELPELLGMEFGRSYEGKTAQALNSELLKHLYDMYESEKGSRGKEYVNLYTEIHKDPVIADAFKVLSLDVKNEANKLFGEEFFPIRRDLLEEVIGVRNASIGDLWTGNTRWNPAVTNTAKKVFEILLGRFMGKNTTYINLMRFEQGIQKTMAYARNFMVIKSFFVSFQNTFSNVIQLLSNGVPLTKIVPLAIKYAKELEDYNKLQNEITKYEVLSGGVKHDHKKYQAYKAHIGALKFRTKHSNIAPIIEAGEYSTIADIGIKPEEIEFSLPTVENLVNTVSAHTPKPIVEAAKFASVSKDTNLYQGLAKFALYGDVISKAILYEHLTTKKNAYSEEEALNIVRDEFVNYDLQVGRTRGWLENMGLMWFFNYSIRSVKSATGLMRRNPLFGLIGLGLTGSLGLSTVFSANLFAKMASGSILFSVGPGMLFQAPFAGPLGLLVD